ncbi:hypothetical protein BN2476_300043 [Paraburkholderia piptadeniae]|uniref:Uncharacterized protein n=1 Tax=Paraburkholderia piptadeniae TaxID=1701573 RepID=A0A1N7S2E9_9BURK|nr:hypothetical protein BN2476_300043 [Paraburkholderia piptadeniae]
MLNLGLVGGDLIRETRSDVPRNAAVPGHNQNGPGGYLARLTGGGASTARGGTSRDAGEHHYWQRCTNREDHDIQTHFPRRRDSLR